MVNFRVVISWIRAHPYYSAGCLFFLIMAFPFMLRKDSEWEEVYVRAAREMKAGGDMYLYEKGYSYPPFMAWMTVPFTVAPLPLARLVYYGINVGAVLLMWRWAWRLAGGGVLNGAATRGEHVIFLLGMAGSVRFVLDGLAHQQTDLIIGCLLLGGCLALVQGRNSLGATALGLAAAMKCTALLWVPYLLWRRKWGAACWLVTVAVGVNLVPSLFYSSPYQGPWLVQWWQQYIRPMNQGSHYPGTWGSDVIYNQSLAGLGQRLLATRWEWTTDGDGFAVVPAPEQIHQQSLRLLVYGTEGILLLLAMLAMGRTVGPISNRPIPHSSLSTPHSSLSTPNWPGLEFSVVLLLMLLFSPMSSKPHFCTLVLPAFCLARGAVTRRSWFMGIMLGSAIVMEFLSHKSLWGDAFYTLSLWWGCITWSSLALLAGCLAGCLAGLVGKSNKDRFLFETEPSRPMAA